MMVVRVAVIGGGAGGLVALRHLTARPDMYKATAFEQSDTIGGTWVYNERLGTDQYGLPVHSSMYKNLVTNLPKEVMAFPDFPFSPSLPSFTCHEAVRDYLNSYADHFNLHKSIKLLTTVNNVKPRSDGGSTCWEVQVSPVTSGLGSGTSKSQMLEFDSVMVCNGHYSVPLMPELPGLETFKGVVVHSHSYRHPEDFQDKTVAVLGGGASGQDIILDLAPCAKKVYFCHRKPPLQSPLPVNVSQHKSIKEVGENNILLEDDSKLSVDVLLICTGYHFKFPFLSKECHPSIVDERITPLYKHIIHADHPTLAFIGIPKTICPFPLFDCQVRFFLASLTGQMALPSRERMLEFIENDYRWRLGKGMPHRHAHTMGTLQWDYNDDLANLGGFQPIPRVVQNLYDYVHATRVKNLPIYKKLNYILVDEEQFKEIRTET